MAERNIVRGKEKPEEANRQGKRKEEKAGKVVDEQN